MLAPVPVEEGLALAADTAEAAGVLMNLGALCKAGGGVVMA